MRPVTSRHHVPLICEVWIAHAAGRWASGPSSDHAIATLKAGLSRSDRRARITTRLVEIDLNEPTPLAMPDSPPDDAAPNRPALSVIWGGRDPLDLAGLLGLSASSDVPDWFSIGISALSQLHQCHSDQPGEKPMHDQAAAALNAITTEFAPFASDADTNARVAETEAAVRRLMASNDAPVSDMQIVFDRLEAAYTEAGLDGHSLLLDLDGAIGERLARAEIDAGLA